jgi:hypothetical protein
MIVEHAVDTLIDGVLGFNIVTSCYTCVTRAMFLYRPLMFKHLLFVLLENAHTLYVKV